MEEQLIQEFSLLFVIWQFSFQKLRIYILNKFSKKVNLILNVIDSRLNEFVQFFAIKIKDKYIKGIQFQQGIYIYF